GAGAYRLLVLIGEYDRRNVAERDGYRSTAAWVSHRAGIDPRTARDYLRVARALRGLPLISAAMATGELSYCKARALTRIARPGTEAEMLDFARMTTVVQLDAAGARLGAQRGQQHPEPDVAVPSPAAKDQAYAGQSLRSRTIACSGSPGGAGA
ncbi:MAG: 13E12 repeat family protein, partial [Proteobacteria bacterium]|nr:13E12 repeat family protein [Pseudomonadota bacterium]